MDSESYQVSDLPERNSHGDLNKYNLLFIYYFGVSYVFFIFLLFLIRLIVDNKVKLNQKLFQRFMNTSRIQRNESRAIQYLHSNLVKFEASKANILKKVFLGVIKYNENFAFKHNINPEKILNLKTLFRLIIAHPENFEVMNEILNEDTNCILNKGAEISDSIGT